MTESVTSDESEDEAQLPVLYDDLRARDVPFDFAIKVVDKEFSVHRETITTHSEYFRAMLAHDTKENQQGFVDVKDVPVDGVRGCIEFMYTGLFNVDAKIVEDILKTADMWQLSNVNNACSEFLKKQLNSGNCVSTLNIATEYNCFEPKEKAQQLYNKNFGVELTKLLQFSKDEFVKYFETRALRNEVAWNAMITWIKHEPARRREHIHELVETLYKKDFPSSGLLENMWAEPTFKCSSQCRELLFEKIFLDLEVFKRSLGVESYFVLEEISLESKYVMKQIKDLLSNFFKRQIVLLSQKYEFRQISSLKILSLFQQKSDIFAPEKWWWNTAIMWVKHDPERKKLFPKLMSFIKFHELPSPFINSVIRHEPLVIGSQERCKLVMSGLLAPEKQNVAYHMAVLYSDGRVRALNISTKSWEDLPSIPTPSAYSVIFNFNRKLCLLNESKLFYLHNDEWMERSSMSSNISTQNITTDDENLYIGDRKLVRYDFAMDKWTEINFPQNFGYLTSIAAFGGRVYVGSNNKTMFILKDTTWTTTAYNSDHSYGLCIAIEDKIYFCKRDRDVYEFDLCFGMTCLQKVPDPNQVTQYQAASYGYPRNESRRKVPNAEVKAVFQHKNRLAAICEGKCYFYDDICRTWSDFVDVPKFVVGEKGRECNIHVTSACSFVL